MNIKKSKIVLALGALLFLSVPLSSAFADQKHNEIKQTQMGGSMQHIKSELRGYVKGVKGDDAQKMQQHLDKLLTLSAMSTEQIPVYMSNMQGMDHASMANGDMEMDGASHDMSTMEGMSPAQNQHMIYMQGIAGLNDLFKELEKAQDKTEIKLILSKIKAQLKKNQQLFG